MHVLTKK